MWETEGLYASELFFWGGAYHQARSLPPYTIPTSGSASLSSATYLLQIHTFIEIWKRSFKARGEHRQCRAKHDSDIKGKDWGDEEMDEEDGCLSEPAIK